MYIDSANLQEIQELAQTGIFKGVTTNPTLLLAERKERLMQLNAILGLDVKRVFVQLEGETASDLFSDFLRLREQLDQPDKVAYKIGINQEGVLAIKKMKEQQPNVTILGTAIYSAEQVYLAALAGCEFVAPYVKRMLVQGIDAYEVIASAKQFIINQGVDCRIMGASFKNAQQVKAVYDAGVDTVTVSKDVFTQLINHDLANQAINVFNQDGRQLLSES